MKKYSIKSGYVLRRVAGEAIVLPIGRQELGEGQTAILNETGEFLWERLQEPATRQQLEAALLEEFEVDAETAERDISAFIETLEKFHFLNEEDI